VRKFHEVAEEFMRDHIGEKRKPHTLASYRAVLKNHLFPVFKTRRIAELSSDDLRELHKKMKRMPSGANRALRSPLMPTHAKALSDIRNGALSAFSPLAS
jgi:hypothetical protein